MNIHVGSESCSRTFSCQHVFRNAANLASPGFLLKSSRNCRSSAKNFKSEPRHLLPALSKAFSLWQRLCTMTYQDYQDTCDQGEVGCTDALGTRTSPRGRRCSAGGGPGRARISLACTGNDWDTENVRKPQLKHSPNTAGTRTRQGHGHE